MKPETRLDPEVVKVQAGDASEPVLVELSWPAGLGPPPAELPLAFDFPRAIAALVEADLKQPLLFSLDDLNLKNSVLDLAMQALPCPSGFDEECRAALSTALDAALASAGIPPSLPDFEELKAAAKGELTDLAPATALNELPAGTACKGVPYCEGQLRKAIAAGIAKSVDSMIK